MPTIPLSKISKVLLALNYKYKKDISLIISLKYINDDKFGPKIKYSYKLTKWDVKEVSKNSKTEIKNIPIETFETFSRAKLLVYLSELINNESG